MKNIIPYELDFALLLFIPIIITFFVFIFLGIKKNFQSFFGILISLIISSILSILYLGFDYYFLKSTNLVAGCSDWCGIENAMYSVLIGGIGLFSLIVLIIYGLIKPKEDIKGSIGNTEIIIPKEDEQSRIGNTEIIIPKEDEQSRIGNTEIIIPKIELYILYIITLFFVLLTMLVFYELILDVIKISEYEDFLGILISLIFSGKLLAFVHGFLLISLFGLLKKSKSITRIVLFISILISLINFEIFFIPIVLIPEIILLILIFKNTRQIN